MNTWRSLDEGGRLREGWLWMEGRRLPSPRTLWLWLRQGCPRDFPVIVREGTITAAARAVDEDGRPVINARDVTIRGWSFSHSLLPMGAIHTHDLISGLLERRLTTVTFPDGHQEQISARYEE